MQTFLPYADFELSARALDVKRLGKQRVEVIQVARALTVPGYGWANHPAVLMWKGYEEALGRYGLTCCAVWTELGFGDTCASTISADLLRAGVEQIRSQQALADISALPPWLGHEPFHRSHQSALLLKDPDHYRPIFPETPDDLPYQWPMRSQAVLAAREARAANAVRRAQRAELRAQQDAERLSRRRSRAARQGWETRRKQT